MNRTRFPGGARRSRRGGFSLLEAVAALVFVSVLAAILVPVFNSGLRSSVEGTARLAATHALRSAMEAWALQVRALDFDTLDDAATTHFASVPDVTLDAAQWVEFVDGGGGAREEFPSGVPTDHLRVTIRHDVTGLRISRVFSRPPA